MASAHLEITLASYLGTIMTGTQPNLQGFVQLGWGGTCEIYAPFRKSMCDGVPKVRIGYGLLISTKLRLAVVFSVPDSSSNRLSGRLCWSCCPAAASGGAVPGIRGHYGISPVRCLGPSAFVSIPPTLRRTKAGCDKAVSRRWAVSIPHLLRTTPMWRDWEAPLPPTGVWNVTSGEVLAGCVLAAQGVLASASEHGVYSPICQQSKVTEVSPPQIPGLFLTARRVSALVAFAPQVSSVWLVVPSNGNRSLKFSWPSELMVQRP